MTTSPVIKKWLAKINRLGVSNITKENGDHGVLPSDRWWQSNSAARVQSGLWGALLLAP